MLDQDDPSFVRSSRHLKVEPKKLGASGKEPVCQCREYKRHVLSLGWKDPLKRGQGNPLQYSSLENPMDREAILSIYSIASLAW